MGTPRCSGSARQMGSGGSCHLLLSKVAAAQLVLLSGGVDPYTRSLVDAVSAQAWAVGLFPSEGRGGSLSMVLSH